jgi:diphthine-ammonia ligase
MKLGVLFSGGKDSVYALAKAKEKHEIAGLISIHSENKESFMFHTPNINLTEMQAKALELPIIIQNTKGEKETELEDLRNAIDKAKRNYKIEGIVTGAIESVYQATRIQKICDELDLQCFNPLWQADQIEHLNEIIKENYKVMIVGVFAEPFTKKWLGRIIDEKAVKELTILHKSHKINPAGEGGEFETLVIDGPIFKKSIEIEKSETFYKNYSGVFTIEEAKLIDKISKP